MTTTLTTPAPTNETDAKIAAQLSHCDRCGALGKLKVELKNGLDLIFCGHHAREYENSKKLQDVAFTFDLV